MDKPALMQELERLTSRERLELAYGLLDSVLHDAEAPPLSDSQRDQLRARLAHHRAHPDEPAVTLDDVRRKLIPGWRRWFPSSTNLQPRWRSTKLK